MRLNPFVYGRPVQPEKLVGRERPINTVFSRVSNGESTAIVGQPHIGKSSLLKYVAHRENRKARLGERALSQVWTEFDCHALPAHYHPKDFWKRILRPIPDEFREPEIDRRLAELSAADYDSFELADFFRHLAERGLQVVLVLDELESLMHHPNFNRVEFFGTLRSCAVHTGGLALIVASRLSVSEINRLAKTYGSPFFNIGPDVKLQPLSENEVDRLLDIMLAGSETRFGTFERQYVHRVAGGHPYLVQAAAASLYDAMEDQKPIEQRVATASALLAERSEAFFDDVWDCLTSEARIAVVLLVLSELKGRIDGREFDTSEIGRMEWYTPELERLSGMGLVEVAGEPGWNRDWDNFVLWHGQRWRVAAESLSWWVCRHPVARGRRGASFEDWLQSKEFEGWLTREERGKVKDLVGKIPQTVLTTAWQLLEGKFKLLAQGGA